MFGGLQRTFWSFPPCNMYQRDLIHHTESKITQTIRNSLPHKGEFPLHLLLSRFRGQRNVLLQVYHQFGLTVTCWSFSPVHTQRCCFALCALNAPLTFSIRLFHLGHLIPMAKGQLFKCPFWVLSAMNYVTLCLVTTSSFSGCFQQALTQTAVAYILRQ